MFGDNQNARGTIDTNYILINLYNAEHPDAPVSSFVPTREKDAALARRFDHGEKLPAELFAVSPLRSTVSIALSSIHAGDHATVTLQAKDADGNNLSMSGLRVGFALGMGGGSGTFGAVTDNGDGTYTATFTGTTAGSNTITATINDELVTSKAPSIIIEPAAATTLVIGSFPTPRTAGATGSFTVTALDAFGNTATGYRGTVGFSSSDGQASLPGKYQFIEGDKGSHGFTATLKTAGSQTLHSTDTKTPSISSTSRPIVVTDAGANRFRIQAPGSTTAGATFSLTVTALDPFANIAIDYRGTVQLSSTDGKATLPANYTITTADQGTHTFYLNLNTTGGQSVTATDTASKSIIGSGTFVVLPGVADLGRSTISILSANLIAGQSTTVTLTALDALGNQETSGGLAASFLLGSGMGNGTFSAVTDNADGTYSSTFSATTAGGNTRAYAPQTAHILAGGLIPSRGCA